ncbi:MAG: hypothetical protein IPN33_01210 [Saprospiraceae bacterium]|nr:hypothetical protein [Saprospiraceae bacterium]
MNEQLKSIQAALKTGEETLTFYDNPIGYNLLDFWKWSVSDILSNATRGIFAEFIVATALDLVKNNTRNEWGAFDLETPNGIKIEVKSSAYIQSWAQKDYSNIIFSIKPSKAWDKESNELAKESKRHVDVYVFCLLHHKNQESINPLSIDQWEFYVLSTLALGDERKTIGLKSLQNLTSSVSYDKLKSKIDSILNID